MLNFQEVIKTIKEGEKFFSSIKGERINVSLNNGVYNIEHYTEYKKGPKFIRSFECSNLKELVLSSKEEYLELEDQETWFSKVSQVANSNLYYYELEDCEGCIRIFPVEEFLKVS